MYSDALQALHIEWTAEALDACLEKPCGDVHGGRMYFIGCTSKVCPVRRIGRTSSPICRAGNQSWPDRGGGPGRLNSPPAVYRTVTPETTSLETHRRRPAPPPSPAPAGTMPRM